MYHTSFLQDKCVFFLTTCIHNRIYLSDQIYHLVVWLTCSTEVLSIQKEKGSVCVSPPPSILSNLVSFVFYLISGQTNLVDKLKASLPFKHNVRTGHTNPEQSYVEA